MTGRESITSHSCTADILASSSVDTFDPRFTIFHELMQEEVQEILLVSTLYDACIMEEDGRLAERIINEYRGLSLTQPPRLNWASSAEEALRCLHHKKFDMVITMRRLADMDVYAFGEELKKRDPDLPVILFTHTTPDPRCTPVRMKRRASTGTFVWTGNADLIVALVKNLEDQLNVRSGHRSGGSPGHSCSWRTPLSTSPRSLPVLYGKSCRQTLAVMEEGLNEEHKLLTMRARPKILVAEDFEQATQLYESYLPYLLGVISDVRFPRNGELDGDAGINFLSRVKREQPDIPLLLTSSEPVNAERAQQIPAVFIDKNPGRCSLGEAFLRRHLASETSSSPSGRGDCPGLQHAHLREDPAHHSEGVVLLPLEPHDFQVALRPLRDHPRLQAAPCDGQRLFGGCGEHAPVHHFQHP